MAIFEEGVANVIGLGHSTERSRGEPVLSHVVHASVKFLPVVCLKIKHMHAVAEGQYF